MKKTGRAMMGSMLFAAMLLGSSAAAEAKTYRVLTNYADSNKTHMIFDTIVKRYQEEVDPDFDVEWEVITSTNNLWDKVRLYLASGDLPDVFNLMNGPIAEEMISDNKLVNMTEALQAEGKYDEISLLQRMEMFTCFRPGVWQNSLHIASRCLKSTVCLYRRPGRNFFRCAKH